MCFTKKKDTLTGETLGVLSAILLVAARTLANFPFTEPAFPISGERGKYKAWSDPLFFGKPTDDFPEISWRQPSNLTRPFSIKVTLSNIISNYDPRLDPP